MYLSKITLRPNFSQQSQLGRVLTDNSYGIHRLLWDLFPDVEQRCFLFREESAREQLGRSKNLPMYYLLSETLPLADSPLFEVQSKEFSPALKEGDRLAFKLRANPVVARRQEGKKHSSHHDVVMDAQRLWLRESCQTLALDTEGSKGELKKRLEAHAELPALLDGAESLNTLLQSRMEVAGKRWLAERGERNGFSIATNQDDEPMLQATGYHWHALPQKGRNAGYASMDYEGELTVTEPTAFLKLLNQGIGRAKAFGCGLMLVKRV